MSETTQTPEVDVDHTEALEGHGGDRNYRKTRQGYVVSDKMDKTITVEVEDRVKHCLLYTSPSPRD